MVESYALRALPGALLRTPALPAAVALRLLDSEDPPAELYALLHEQPEILEVIRTASSSLASAVRAWLAVDLQRDHAAVRPATAYVLRAATRATPFASCSCVSPVYDAGDVPRPRLGARVERRIRPDYLWLSTYIAEIASREGVAAALRIYPSGLAYELAGRLRIGDVVRSQAVAAAGRGSLVPDVTSVKPTGAVRTALGALVPGMTLGALADAVALATGASAAHALGFVTQLLEFGLFVSETRIGPVGDSGARACELLGRVAPDAAAELEALLAELDGLAGADAPRFAAGFEAAEAHAARLASADNFLQTDSLRPDPVVVDRRWQAEIAAGLATLTRISPQSPLPLKLATAFADAYNIGRAVPLLEVLDPSEGFEFESITASAPVTPRDEMLVRWAMDTFASGGISIELTEDRLHRLEPPDSERRTFPDSFEAVAQVGTLADGAFGVVMGGGYRGAYRSMGRFLPYFPHLRAVVSTSSPALETPDDTVTAEVVTVPFHRRLTNVSTRDQLATYQICCGATPSVPAERVLLLDDLLVSSDGARLALRSKRLNKFVRVIQPHMANAAIASRLEMFLDAAYPESVPQLAFDWGGLADKLPYRPRVTIGRTVLVPQTWRLPREIALDRDVFRRWRKLWRVPDRIVLADRDNKLVVDMRRETFEQQVMETVRKSKGTFVLLEELSFDLAAGAVDRDGEAFGAELAVSFATPAQALAPPPQWWGAPPPRSEAVMPPGGAWTSAQLYLGVDRVDVFLASDVAPLLEALAPVVDRMHFVRYADPGAHVRLRLHAPGDPRAALLAVVGPLHALVENGTLKRFSLTTYEREVERYGGVACIGVAEEIFDADSRAAIAAFAAGELATRAALYASIALFASDLHGDLAVALAWLKRVSGRRAKLPADAWLDVKAGHRTFAEALADAPDAGRAALRAAAAELRGSAHRAEHDGILRALLHMHCNRIGVRAPEEADMVNSAIAILEQETHRDRGTAQRMVRS